MKRVRMIATFILIFTIGIIYAQDVIIFKGGKEIEVEIVEDSKEIIKYKKYKDTEGPTFLLNKSKILRIKYPNREKDNSAESESIHQKEETVKGKTLKIEHKIFGMTYFESSQEISKDELVGILKSNPDAYRQYKIGRNLNTIGNVIGIPAGLVLGYNVVTWARKKENRNQSKNKKVLFISGLCWGGGTILSYVGKEVKRRAGKTYNTSKEMGYRLNISENGVGIAFHF